MTQDDRVTLLLSALLFAAPVQTEATAQPSPEAPPRNFINLRVGASSASRRVELCGEAGYWRLSIEACGTGAELLHREASSELVHFRLKFLLAQVKTLLGWLEGRVSAGFTEMQVGQDDDGFAFTGTNAARTSTSGPSVGTSLRLLVPVWNGFELLAELSASLSYHAFAPQLLPAQSVWQPAIGLSVGAGF